MRLAFLALALAAGRAAGQPLDIPRAAGDGPFSPPARIAPKNGVALYVPPATVVDARYVALDGEGAFDASAIGGSKTAFVFFARGLPPGKTYRFVGIGSDAKGNLTEVAFEVPVPGAPPPPPPPPPPHPGPAVPEKLKQAVAAAYAEDAGTAAEKADLRRELRIMYETAVAQKIAFDPEVTTGDQFVKRMKAAGKAMTNDQLTGTRIAIAEWLEQSVRLADTLTAAQREAVDARLREIAAALAQ